MESHDRPTRTRSRLWFLIPCVVAIPVFVGTFLGEYPSALTILAVASLAAALGAALLAAWLVVRTHRQRQDYEARLEAWASERSAHRERLEIARELHDLTSHGISLITIRAASTANLTGQAGEAERRIALGEIEQIGRETMTELRRMLTVLRNPTDGPGPRQPADSLEELPAIVRAAQDAGLDVSLDVGPLPALPASVQLTVCSVVREALANTMRHAGPTSARVTVAEWEHDIVVAVHDDGPSPGWKPQAGSGHGLAGVRERLLLHQGALHLDPAEHGFTLRATIPIGAA